MEEYAEKVSTVQHKIVIMVLTADKHKLKYSIPIIWRFPKMSEYTTMAEKILLLSHLYF